jgi:hypothetical protein
MARLNSKIFVLIASLLFALTTAAQKCPAPTLWDFNDRQVAGREYNFWIEADRIARMPDPQRATQIPHVYRDIFADLHKRWYALDNWMILPVRLDGYRKSKAPEHKTPEQWAEQWARVGMQSGYPNMFSQGIALALFIGYPRLTQPLILQDLRSADPEAISRGIYVAGRMQESAFPDLFDDLKRISFSDGPCADEALQSLVSYSLNFGFPILGTSVVPSSRALDLVPLLVPRFQKQPERYGRSLRELLRFAPPPKALLADLDSSDANLRRNALFALADNKEPIPTRYILQLAADRDPKMRAWSIGLGFEKRRSDFSLLKPTLAKLMYDPEFDVRLAATKNFAAQGDPISASPLLGLLKEVYRTGNGEFFTLAMSADAVAHQKFGFDSGTERVPLQNERNEGALKRYANWVRLREH